MTNDTRRDPKDAHDALAEKLYGREKRPLPEVAGRMYSYSPADEAFKSRTTDLFTQAGMSPTSVQEQHHVRSDRARDRSARRAGRQTRER